MGKGDIEGDLGEFLRRSNASVNAVVDAKKSWPRTWSMRSVPSPVRAKVTSNSLSMRAETHSALSYTPVSTPRERLWGPTTMATVERVTKVAVIG